jgi:transposase
MLSDRETIRRLRAASRRKPTVRELCCPDCGGEIELRGGWLVCQTFECFSTFKTLAELAVRASPEPPSPRAPEPPSPRPVIRLAFEELHLD